jgi:hypothetical protein
MTKGDGSGVDRVGTPLPVEGSDRPQPGVLVVRPASVQVRFQTGETIQIREAYQGSNGL